MDVCDLQGLQSISPGIGITLALKLHEFYDSRGHKPSLHLLTQEGKCFWLITEELMCVYSSGSGCCECVRTCLQVCGGEMENIGVVYLSRQNPFTEMLNTEQDPHAKTVEMKQNKTK